MEKEYATVGTDETCNIDEQATVYILSRDDVLYKRKHYWVLRRAQDVVLSTIALVILWPFMLGVALVIYVDDPHGSPIFSQTRVGRDGKEFKLYKFRSMYVNAEAHLDELMDRNEMDGPAFKMKNDPRITRVGHFIRKTRVLYRSTSKRSCR